MQKICAASFLFFFSVIIAVQAIPPLAIQETESGYRIQMTLPEPVIEKEAVNTVSSDGRVVNDTFVRVMIYGFDYDGAEGEPAMLSGQFHLALEQDAPQVVSVDDLVTETIALGGKLYPVQPPYCYCGSHEQPAFVYHPETYVRTVKGDPIAVTAAYTYRGQNATTITVEPMSYDPETNTAVVIKQMNVSITMDKPKAVRSLHSREFDKIMRALFVNIEDVPSEEFYAKEKYLIIAEPAYLQNADLQRLVDYRSALYDVKLVSTNDVGGTTKEAYRAYIYNQEKPTFCLLVGSNFPSWQTNSWWSLNYYIASQITSTSQKPLPSIAMGLFWVTSASQIANIVNKTIQTESTLDTRTKVVLGQGGNTEVMGRLPAEHCDRLVEEVNNRYFTASTGFQVFNYGSTSGGAQRAVDRFNQGCWFNIYNGHGSTSGQGFGWGSRDLSSMRNTQYPFVLTCGCLTGTYNKNCIAAAAVAHQYGPVTYIGSNNNSSLGQHVLTQGYVAAIMGHYNITKNGLAFVFGVNYDSVPRAVSQYTSISTNIKALMGWQYHHFGDPAIETMKATPVTPYISVTAPASGEQWEQGTTQEITWSDNISGSVKIDLYSGNTLSTTLAASTESDGSFEWDIGSTAAGNDYKIRITSVDSAALWDTSAVFSIIEEYIITPPYYLSFDELDSGSVVMPMKYAQATSDDIDWIVWKGPTPSRVGTSPDTTGPMCDHTSGSGKYIYIEASSTNNPNKRAEFVTPNFRISGTGLTLSFWVHMMSLNNTMGNLVLDICVDGTWRTNVLSITGNQGMEWIQKTVDLTPYAGDRVNFRFRGTTGSSWASDICIDDIQVDGTVATEFVAIARRTTKGLTVQGCTIRCSVPENAARYPVKVTVYNSQGKAIRTLVNQRLPAGSHVLHAGDFAAGLYVVKLQARGIEQTANMLITR